ncbi:tRNA-binding protein [Candidatus Dojkabacteria bacterium]|nr:tRNA-binding protein [Candidatus Dojkabacteria bacterium]
MNEVSYEDFKEINIRVGKILDAKILENGKYSTHKLKIDFGSELGLKKSCARLVNYEIDDLIGRFIVAVVNFPPKQIGTNISEVLVLGVPDLRGECSLLKPDAKVPLGGKMY